MLPAAAWRSVQSYKGQECCRLRTELAKLSPEGAENMHQPGHPSRAKTHLQGGGTASVTATAQKAPLRAMSNEPCCKLQRKESNDAVRKEEPHCDVLRNGALRASARSVQWEASGAALLTWRQAGVHLALAPVQPRALPVQALPGVQASARVEGPTGAHAAGIRPGSGAGAAA